MPPPAIAAISLAPLSQATGRKAIVTCPAYEPVNLGINSTEEKMVHCTKIA
jgi:hypothetical protein